MTIPAEARIAEHASSITASPDWTRVAKETARRRSDGLAADAEKCPPRELSQRLWPLFVALRVLADGMDRSAIVAVFAPFAVVLLRARLAQLAVDMARLADAVSAQLDAPAGINAPGASQHSEGELQRARRLHRLLSQALEQLTALQTSDPGALAGLVAGELCPTCLCKPVDGCRSGWLEGPTTPERVHPLSLECPHRASLNGNSPRTYDRDARRFLEVTP